MSERRLDPRTDPQYSLRNLLRIRAEREGLEIAVISTAEGLLMAGSHEGRAAQRIAAEAALLVRASGSIERLGAKTGAAMRAIRFDSRGRALCLAVLRTQAAAEEADLEGMAGRVRKILAEAEARAALRQSA